MDQAILVEDQIEDGRRLIIELAQHSLDVAAAAWLKTSEEGQWFLYIASEMVDTVGLAKAYKIVYLTIQKMPGLSIDPFDVKLIGPNNAIAIDILGFQQRFPATIPTRFRGTRLGAVPVDEAYLYPAVP